MNAYLCSQRLSSTEQLCQQHNRLFRLDWPEIERSKACRSWFQWSLLADLEPIDNAGSGCWCNLDVDSPYSLLKHPREKYYHALRAWGLFHGRPPCVMHWISDGSPCPSFFLLSVEALHFFISSLWSTYLFDHHNSHHNKNFQIFLFLVGNIKNILASPSLNLSLYSLIFSISIFGCWC
jgi:hypothetical protein